MKRAWEQSRSSRMYFPARSPASAAHCWPPRFTIYGLFYELYFIAAVVVGGTSLSGGQGRIFGPLVGVLIIPVMQNGMNLTGLESYTHLSR